MEIHPSFQDDTARNEFFYTFFHPENQAPYFHLTGLALESGEDFLDAGREIRIDPSDYYLANPRTTIVLIAK